jgi:hypothetical protein
MMPRMMPTSEPMHVQNPRRLKTSATVGSEYGFCGGRRAGCILSMLQASRHLGKRNQTSADLDSILCECGIT